MNFIEPRFDAPQSAEKTLADHAYKLMREDLLACRLEPSTRLRLTELQHRYGLGLSPLREALLRLVPEGLVFGEGQRGFTVAAVSLAELEDLTRTRMQIESIALAEAIAHGDADWEANVLSAFHRLSRSPMPANPTETETAVNWEQKHRAFHDALVTACGSPWLLRFHSQLVDHSERYRRARLFIAPSVARLARDSNAEHRAIMEAVLARDAPKACELMREHLQRTAVAAAQDLQPVRNTKAGKPKSPRPAPTGKLPR